MNKNSNQGGKRAVISFVMCLFIAKKVAERHNGALLLTNKDGGCGAAVTLIINRIDDKANHQL